MKIDKRIPKYAVIGGSLTALLLIMYFLIASAFDFKEIVELRYFNILILSLGIFATQYLFHHHAKERLTNYLNGIALGMGTGLLAGVTFSLFFYGFLKFAAPDFGLVLREVVPFKSLSVELLALISFVETLLPSFMATFISLQFFKNVDDI